MSRMVRRVIILSLVLSFSFLVGIGWYFIFLKTPETCFDGIKNQNEQGVDCAGICTAACIETVTGRDFQAKEVVFVSGGDNRYDVLGRIFNPNDSVGASSFRYVFELHDATGQIVATRSGTSYILPQETKSLMELNLETTVAPTTVTFMATDIVWEKFTGYQEKPALNIYQKRYNQVTSGFGYSEAYGLLTNESQYDFRSILIQVILRDDTGKPLAFNKTKQDTIKAGESRDFRLVWPVPFPGKVDRFDTEIDADVYHSENFMRQYFPGGRYR